MMKPFFSRFPLMVSLCAFLLLMALQGSGLAMEGKLDLNTVTAKELQTLPGIGKEIANRIVEYRQDHGPFKDVLELRNVKGIGKAKLANIQEHLTIDVQAQSHQSQ